MKHCYDIPRVTVKSPPVFVWASGVIALALFLAIRHIWFIMSWGQYRILALLWMFYFIITSVQWALSWLERPYTVDRERQAKLDRMKVTVSIPIFNEDPEVVDRVLYALFQQSRLPNRVQVVDDGSEVDYDEVRSWWVRQCPRSVDFTWSAR